jgi:hypothetical protein
MARAGRSFPNRQHLSRAVITSPVNITGDTPAALRLSGPDGTLILDVILTNTPSAERFSGPDGLAAIGVVLTDSPSAERDYGPEGLAGTGIVVGPDSPAALRDYGPDGSAQLDLALTSPPTGVRDGGFDGSVSLGLTLTDTPSAGRDYGPSGSVFADVAGGVTLTDTPSASRYYGPSGALALGLAITGDLPSGARLSGPDGAFSIGFVLTDSPAAERLSGPDGVVVAILSDSPGSYRSYGPSGTLAIDLLLAGDTPGASRLSGPVGVISIGVGADVIAGTATPGQVRYAGGCDGDVLLAFLPSKPPYIPVAPLIAPAYALWLADTRTGKMLWRLPMQTLSWSSKLNDIGTLRATLAIEKTWDTLSDQDERDPRILLREIISGPWRFSLVLKWGNNTVWAGPYINMSRPSPDHIELNGAEIAKIFTKRPLIKPGATSAVDVTADTVFSGATKSHVAAALITQAMSGTGYNLPITVTDLTAPGTDGRIYYGYDLANYWEKLSALMAEVDGPEIRFDPQVSPGVDGDYLSWVTQIGGPHVGRSVTTWVFDSSVNSVVGMDVDGSTMALGVWSGGSGQSRDRLVAHAQDASLLNIGWPMIEEVDNSHTSEVVYPVLASQASAGLAAHKQPITSFRTLVPADSDPMVGTYRVGEDFAIDIHDDPIIPNGFYTRRIAGLSGSEKPWVTITDADSLPVGSS